MKVTAEEIEAARSPRGGWTKATLAKWGVPWPPPKGWRQRLLKGEAPDHQCECKTCGRQIGDPSIIVEEEPRPAAFFDEHDMAAIGAYEDDDEEPPW